MNQKFLFVSNDQGTRKELITVCQNNEIEVEFVENNLATMLKLFDKEVDIIILDIEDSDKLTYCEFMMLKNLRSEINVIGLFKDATIECLQLFRQSGLLYFSTQPVKSGELLEIINIISKSNCSNVTISNTFTINV